MNNYTENCALNAAGLAIKATTTAVVKTSNTFRVKANGLISAALTTADTVSLLTAKGPKGATTSNLADGYTRIYTCLGAVNTTTGVITTSWVHGPDYLSATYPVPSLAFVNNGNSGDESKAIIGYVIVKNATGAAFVPNTTVLDVANLTVTYIDRFGFDGL